MANKWEAEIRRKAENGIKLANPTAESQASYDKHQQYIKNEIQKKALSGQQLDSPNEWKNNIYQSVQKQHANALPESVKNTNQGKPATTPTQWVQQRQAQSRTDNSAQLSALSRYLRQSGESQYDSQKTLLDQARNQQIKELEKAYADAVAQGEISVREAEEAFEANKRTIEEQAYLDSEQTELVAQSRGIQNSQQLLGMQAGDNARNQSLVNENMTTRDRRVADIKDRIKAIGTQKNLDIAGVNNQYNMGLQQARSAVDAQTAQQMFQLGLSDYQMNREQDFALNQMGYAQQLDLQKMDKSNAQQLAQLAYQQGLNLETMNAQQVHQLAQMAVQNGYNIDMTKLQSDLANQQATHQSNLRIGEMGVQNQYQLGQMAQQQQYTMAQIAERGRIDASAMARQHGYSMAELSARQKADLDMLQKKINADIEASDREYEKAMSRELKKYTPGTDEYEIVQGQLEQQKQIARQEIFGSSQVQAQIEHVMNNYVTQQPTPPTQNFLESLPGTRWYNNHQRDLQQYELNQDSYNKYLRFLETGELPE